ncbi:MAG: ATP-binding cassette domain-containing protein [Prevotellaceae bacterium]|nr:ATP-binding cassette domain-containing protein [Prevotellaceae bacterium]
MISVNDLTVSFGGFTLFNGIGFMINPNDRIGLVGKNGAGKSTLLKILMGLQQPTFGQVSVPSDFTMGYLPQQMTVTDGKTVFKETLTAYQQLNELEKQIEKITEELHHNTDYESDAYMKLIEQLNDANDRFHLLGGSDKEGDTEQTLLGLGFKRSDFDRPTFEFSGGWRMRIELAKILLTKPRLLLLDEPTNHLDIESIQWLEDYLKNYNGMLVLISHDRAFLDAVTNRTIEISLGKAYDYRASYSRYVELRKKHHEQQLSTYQNQQKMIEKTEDFIERFRYKATKANQVQSRIKQLEKMEIVEVDEEDTTKLNIKFPPAPRSGQVVFHAKDLTKRYGDHTVFANANIIVERGEKVALVGRNGEGKTTLSRIIIGELMYEEGVAKLGYNVNLGYFAQNQDDLMDGEETVFNTLDRIAVGDIRTKLRDILGAFLFRGDDVDKKVKVLSGGERSRLAMAWLMLEPYNLLVLDEPTNHMDMRSKDILKNALQLFDGTLIVVSHDREFLDGLVDKVYEFRDGKVKEHLGGIREFLQRRKLENLQELEWKNKEMTEKKEEKQVIKQDYGDKKEYDKQMRKVNTQIEKEEKIIAKIESVIADMDNALTNPTDKVASNDFYKKYQQLKNDLNIAIQRWEQLHQKLEKLT